MNAAVVCVGKLKETWLKEGCAEYIKRLSRFGGIEIVELADQPEPAKPSDALERKIMEIEGKEILRRIKQTDFVVALCIGGTAVDSVGLADALGAWQQLGRRIVFVIGGSLGLSPEVVRRADHKLSFSQMTFPHGLMRLILLEQVYRAAKIGAGERYHK